jgi:hypothetical protein
LQVALEARYAGPPTMGHGGYVSGLLASRTGSPVEVTLRRPIPLDRALELVDVGGGALELRDGDEVLVSSRPVDDVDLEGPPPPTLDAARAAEAGSPSFAGERGVHPICFGCGNAREDDDGLRIFAGPATVDGHDLGAATWRPGAALADADGTVDATWVLAALDCPGAVAFIATGVPAGLLGRITFRQHGPVRADAEHVVTGWQVGTDGRKLLAGTALFDAAGTLLASARAVWFPMPGGLPTLAG